MKQTLDNIFSDILLIDKILKILIYECIKYIKKILKMMMMELFSNSQKTL
jgi:hypothetical protein